MIYSVNQKLPEQGQMPVLFRDENNEYHIGRFSNGYWFTGTEVFGVTHWADPKELFASEEVESLVSCITQWHYDRNLVHGSDPKTQFVKLITEAGELGENILKKKDIRDDIGDMIVVLILIAIQNKTNIFECMAHAWNDIKDRKGTMINGAFVKES